MLITTVSHLRLQIFCTLLKFSLLTRKLNFQGNRRKFEKKFWEYPKFFNKIYEYKLSFKNWLATKGMKKLHKSTQNFYDWISKGWGFIRDLFKTKNNIYLKGCCCSDDQFKVENNTLKGFCCIGNRFRTKNNKFELPFVRCQAGLKKLIALTRFLSRVHITVALEKVSECATESKFSELYFPIVNVRIKIMIICIRRESLPQ